ncbi:alpha/beta-hydrolase [Mycena latifolia]|nr:alpha/beta-hydrolase [Mycena latifolia]
MDPTLYKKVKTQRGFTYSYYFSPPTAGKPVLFFAHGFPSSSYLCWRSQVAFFKPLGYGLIVPDFLGYGGTDKPTDPKLYIGSGLAQDAVDIFDAEGISQVVAIGHDWGSYMVARLVNHHPSRVAACAFLAVGYAPPGSVYKDAVTQGSMTKLIGYDNFAYIRFFIQTDAAEIIEKNIDSFLALLYPETPEIWKNNMCVDGGARAWVENNRMSPIPSYMTPELVDHERTALLKGGLSGPLCWYKVVFEDATSEGAALPQAAHDVTQPLLFVACTRDVVCLPVFGDTNHAKYAKGGVTRRELDGDHWVVESHPAELSVILNEWIKGLGV